MTKYMFFRILGNDLPPRHVAGQQLRNLEFILENEPRDPLVSKGFVLNRIYDALEEERILKLVEAEGLCCLHIPFDWDEYAKAPDKRMYATNVNQARNLALQRGRAEADWILPMDGSCCFDCQGLDRLIERLERERDLAKCFAVPMFRLMDYKEYFASGPDASMEDEPQIVFGRNAAYRFDEHRLYNENTKFSLLKNIFHTYDPQKGFIRDTKLKCGSVLRLPSGFPELDGPRIVAHELRVECRRQGMDDLISRIETDRLKFFGQTLEAEICMETRE